MAVPKEKRGLRAATERRAIAASSDGDAGLVALWVVAGLVLAWITTYSAGGSQTVLPHTFYVPVVLAAVRFGAKGVLFVSVVAGLLVGPLMPLDVDAGTAQTAANWVGRLAFLALVGLLVAYLTHYSVPSLRTELARRRLRGELEVAIAEGQLRLEYQPVVELSDGTLAGVEALVRWDHPERGAVPPDEFIPAAEQAGCIDQVTRFVIDEACAQAKRWRPSLPAGADFALAVNISALDLSDAALPALVSAALQREGLPSHWLHLEITETALVADVEVAVEGLMGLRDLGVRIAIDDFGTGESCLAALRQFPADVVKVDRYFVRNLGSTSADLALAQAVIRLAQILELEAVVEGVETEEQARAILDTHCPRAQGFLFSKPLRSEGIDAILADLGAFRRATNLHLGRLDPSPQPPGVPLAC